MIRQALFIFWKWTIATTLALQLAVAAEEPVSPVDSGSQRMRIGLVLGGGGARGAAHIGVLRELERLRIPIDAIAGTSMGAIVGGLYAAGMSPAELQELAETLDWDDALSDAPVRRDLSFRRKKDDEKFPIDIGVRVRDGKLILPKGVLQGQKLDLLLRHLTIGVSHIKNFDDLPIPFRAIASDLESGKARVMDSGDLALSIRASMSVPGLLAPVELDGRLLVDGGITRNLPVSVMQEMGVDIIIAVNTEFPLYKAGELESVVSISEQVLTILMRNETVRQIDLLEAHDVFIQPDLGLFASTNFTDIAQTVEPGAAATLAVAGRLQPFSLDEPTYAALIRGRSNPSEIDATLAFVRVEEDGRVSPEVLETRLETRAGDSIDADKLAADANRLYGMMLFDQVSYRLVEEKQQTGVEFDAKPNSWGPNYLQFGVALEDNFEGSTAFNLSAQLTATGINALGAEWQTDLQVGTDPAIFSEFYQPLNASSLWFVAPRVGVQQSNRNAFVEGSNIARYRITETQFGLDFGAELGPMAEFRVGVFGGSGDSKVKVGSPSLPKTSFDTGGMLARLRVDSFDDAWFPRSGIRANASLLASRTALGADMSFEAVSADLAAAWSRGKNSLLVSLAYATNSDSDIEIQNYVPLGGFLRLSGLDRGEISGPNAGLVRLLFYRRVSNSASGLFDVPLYIGASLEAGNVWQTRSDVSFNSMQTNGSVFISLDTFLGPIYLAGGFAEDGEQNVYLYIGSRPR